ncbi:MAG TPA: YidC/Oxa1 family membrane protein insertase [Patescibacteria group bacterium]|nr:YidC/Oxa1 family membrane protein insertase [Patescibacteria group bacterium]
MLADIYNVILYQPIFNILVFFYNIVPGHDIGLAIILLTILIKVVLSPFFVQSIKAQRAMQRLQPKLDELKEKYKDNKEKLGPAIMQLYQKEKVSPFSSCIPLLIQLPFLIAVFQVFRVGLGNGTLDIVYPFIYNPGQINHIAFGFIDFSQASIALAVLAGLAQFIQSKSLLGKKNQLGGAKPSAMTAAMGKQMMYMMPVVTVLIGSSMPGGLTFYWFLVTILGALQQIIVFKKMDQRVEVKT